MSKISLDELIIELTNHEKGRPYSIPEDQLQTATTELLVDVFAVGSDALSRLSQEKLAGIFSLVQTGVLTAAIAEGNLKLAMLVSTKEFSDAVVFAVQATAGILTMEEVR